MKNIPNLKELIWAQEGKPLNQGAWYAKHHRMTELIKKGQTLGCCRASRVASPAVGYAARHALQQKKFYQRRSRHQEVTEISC